MHIAIIGAGNVGHALGGGWLRTGHDVVFDLRNPTDLKYTGLAGRRAPPMEAASGSDVIVLATPWPAAESVVRALGKIEGKIVVDCMNPFATTTEGLARAVGPDFAFAVARKC